MKEYLEPQWHLEVEPCMELRKYGCGHTSFIEDESLPHVVVGWVPNMDVG